MSSCAVPIAVIVLCAFIYQVKKVLLPSNCYYHILEHNTQPTTVFEYCAVLQYQLYLKYFQIVLRQG